MNCLKYLIDLLSGTMFLGGLKTYNDLWNGIHFKLVQNSDTLFLTNKEKKIRA